MTEKKKSSRVWEFLLIFALVYLLSEMAFKYFAPKSLPPKEQQSVTLEATSNSFRRGHFPVLTVANNTDRALALPARCPAPPFDVFRVLGTGTGESLETLTSTEIATPCAAVAPIAGGGEATVELAPWKYSLFDEPGIYEVRIPSDVGTGSGGVVTARFGVHEPGVIVKMFRTFVTKPFLNFLIFAASFLPGHNLGIAIILLTLLVKLILYFPSQHAMEGQRKMQLIQPRIQELQKRFKDDPKKLHEETLKIWRQEGVNPFQSCLPIVLQLPILIGLLYVIRDGSNLALSREFIYPFYQHLSWNFSTYFLGLELTRPSWIFAPILVLLQFYQMRLTFQAAKKKQTAPADPSQKMQQQMMQYTMPLLIGFFAFQFPGAVSLYWAVSTVFAVGQQIVANRKVG